MNTAAWEALLACKYAAPDIPATMGHSRHSGSELDLLFSLGCMRFHRRAPLRPSLSALYTYIPLRLLPVHRSPSVTNGSRASYSYGTLAAQLVKMAASTVGEFSAQTIILDLEGLKEFHEDISEHKDEGNEKGTKGSTKDDSCESEANEGQAQGKDKDKKHQSLAEGICPHVYEAIRSMHATLAPNWRNNAHKLSTLYILGCGSNGMRIYTTTIVHEQSAKSFLTKHRMFSISAESSTGSTLCDVITTAQKIPCSPNWDDGDLDPRIVKGALLRMVSSVEDAVVGDAVDASANRAATRTAIRSIVLEQSLRNDFGINNEKKEKDRDNSTQENQISDNSGKPTLDTLLLSRLLLEPNYIPKLSVSGSIDVGKDILSLRQILGAFAIAAQAPPSTPLFEAEGDLVYRGRDTLGVLSSVARMAVVLLASGVDAALCAAYLATPINVIKEIGNREQKFLTPKAIGTVGIAAAGLESSQSEAVGIAETPEMASRDEGKRD